MRQEQRFGSFRIGLLAMLILIPSMTRAQPSAAEAAEAQDADEEAMARQRYEAGQVNAEAGRYQQAHDEFSAGYRLSRRPLFLYNMAEASYELGQHELAEREYERYVRQDPDGSMAPRARERLASLSARHADTTEASPDVVPAPEEAALAADDTSVPSVLVRPVDNTPPDAAAWYEDWPFWVIVASSAVLIGAGLAIGITLANDGSQPPCGMGCFRVDIGGSI